MRPLKVTLELAHSTLLDVHYRRSVELKTVMTCLDRGYYGDVDSDFVADLRGAVGRIDA